MWLVALGQIVALKAPTFFPFLVQESASTWCHTMPTKTASPSRKPAPVKETPAPTRISHALNPKTVPGVGKIKHDTVFSQTYASGGIPCRLLHGSVKHKVEWSMDPNDADLDRLLPVFFDGLRETSFPYTDCLFVLIAPLLTCYRLTLLAYQGLLDLLSLPAVNGLLPMHLTTLAPSLRLTLNDASKEIFSRGLTVLPLLASSVGEALLPHLPLLVAPLSKKCTEKGGRGEWSDQVMRVLAEIELACGPMAGNIIKAKVPTYQKVNM